MEDELNVEKPARPMPKIFGAEYVTHELAVAGLVRNPLRLSVAELRGMELVEVRDLKMVCGSGEELELIGSYRGVPLVAILKRAEIIKRDRGSSGRIYVTITSSDGRGALFSYQELFNSVNGEGAIVIVEKNGAPLDESEGKIAFVSAKDLRSGARKLRYVARVGVHEHNPEAERA